MEKIKVCDLEPNPYRDYKKDPINQDIVDGLKDSIRKGQYWGGIPIRRHPTKKGKYEIGCGHHRLAALKECGIKEIEAPVVEFSDIEMLRTMILENATQKPTPKKSMHEIGLAYNELSRILELYGSWEQFEPAQLGRLGFPSVGSAQAFATLKRDGVGRDTLREFLGPSMSKNLVTQTLATLKASKGKDAYLSMKAVEILPTTESMGVFRQAVKKHDIPKKKQIEIAKEIVEEGIGKRDIPATVEYHSLKPVKQEEKEVERPTLDKYATQTSKAMHKVAEQLKAIDGNIKNIVFEAHYFSFIEHVEELSIILHKIEKEIDNDKVERKTKTVDNIQS